MVDKRPIAVFDSGVGGLSVMRAIHLQLPTEDVIFLADQAHVPYGPRSLQEIRQFSEQITRYFLSLEAKLVVVACNTASAAALHYLRQTFPQVPFVGMEPAVKPAAEETTSGVVGVLATEATFQGELYASVVERFANGVKLLQDPCIGLVAEIERGDLDGEGARQILENALKPMLAAGIDTVVLGCTHYPFVFPLIRSIVGRGVRLIDPSPAVARQVGWVLAQQNITNDEEHVGSRRYLTTGDGQVLGNILQMLGMPAPVERVSWEKELELH
jgi:glutamate racemase